MKVNRKLNILLLGVLLLAVALACRAVLPDTEEGSTRLSPTGEAGETAGGGSTITVTADDFSLALQPAHPAAGEVTFVVDNQGHLPHDFRIRGNGVDQRTPLIAPQESETLTLQLVPGTYDYVCTVEGHAMLGMSGSFTVEASSTNGRAGYAGQGVIAP